MVTIPALDCSIYRHAVLPNPVLSAASLMGGLPLPVPPVLPAQLVALSGLAVPLPVLPGLIVPPSLVPPPSMLASDLSG